MAKQEERKSSGGTQGKPNILVIWGDDIGIWNLSCYSHGTMGYRNPQHRPHRQRRDDVHRFLW